MHNNTIISKKFIINLKRKIHNRPEEMAFICIGSNKIIGDSIGPRIGSFLKKNTKLQVYGDMRNNLSKEEEIKNISNKLKNKFIVAIDSALSNNDDIGEIYVTSKSLKMAEGINLDKGNIGDLSIKVVVAKNTNDRYRNYLSLKNTDIEFINNLAITVANGIREASR